MNMRTTKNTLDHTVVAFDELPPSGAYSIAISTRRPGLIPRSRFVGACGRPGTPPRFH